MDSSTSSPSPFMPQSQTTIPAPAPLPPKRSTGTRVVASILIIALLCGGYFAFAYVVGWWPYSSPEPVVMPTPTATADPMTGGVIYENNRYTFALTLPEGYSAEPLPSAPDDNVEFLSPEMQELRAHNKVNCDKVYDDQPLPSGEYCAVELRFVDFTFSALASGALDGDFSKMLKTETFNGYPFELWQVGGGMVNEYAYLFPFQPEEAMVRGFFVYEDGPASSSENLRKLREVLVTFRGLVITD